MAASTRTKRGALGALALAALLAIGGYALTNTLTFEESSTVAGFGGATVQELTVTDIDYTLGTTDKSQVTQIDFTVSPAVVNGNNADANGWVSIDNGTTWQDCGAVADGATSVTCDITDTAVANLGPTAADQIQLVVAE